SRKDIRSLRRFPRSPGDRRPVLVYQAAGYSPAAEFVSAREERLVVNYHNVTPAEFFWPWEPSVAASLRAGREQIAALAAHAELAIADSPYNAEELAAWGYRRIVAVPCLIDTERLVSDAPSPWPVGAGTKWLFVGRIAPNKAQHEVVKAFTLYRMLYDPDAVLALPGRSSSHRYQHALNRFIHDVGLDEVVLRPGAVTDDVLGAYYRDADVYVCLSRHEGFCNTVIEAMAAGVPVVSLAAAALPTTIGDAGILLPEPGAPGMVAAAVHRVVTDRGLAQRLIAHGYARQRQLALEATADRICDLIAEVLPA
ncbi:MAG TPA: glycosyltransferase family 4 protein, partial [Acidimicrobiales bacterium]|nr:glycosyltransferase family 4 protein [Acidimicrobiales bacterium]